MSIVILIKIRYNNTVRHKGVSHSLQTVRENMRDNGRKVTGLCILLFLLAMTAGCGREEDDRLQEISLGAEGTQQTADGEGIIEHEFVADPDDVGRPEPCARRSPCGADAHIADLRPGRAVVRTGDLAAR